MLRMMGSNGDGLRGFYLFLGQVKQYLRIRQVYSKMALLEVINLKAYFYTTEGIVKAVDGVDVELNRGEILSLVGESGSGKTTTGKAILQLAPLSGGEIFFNGEKLDVKNKTQISSFRRKAQMIFQDPYQSLNPRHTILDIVAEALDVNHLTKNNSERFELVAQALNDVGMTPAEDFFYRYPYELSGGQRQRVVIAGAMIMDPTMIIADEPVSMLDASIRIGILKLMLNLREKRGLSYLFITHDLSLAWLISDRIAIMYLGRIMEIGNAEHIIKNGQHPYTKALTSIMPLLGKGREEYDLLKGETPNPSEVISGCKFYSRCPVAKERCSVEMPELRDYGDGNMAACHYL